jgi:nitrogen regulatory protein PII
MVGDSLVPAMSQSLRSADVEIVVNASSKVTHVISLDVKVVEEEELGQAEVTVHDVADVRIRSLLFFLI